MKPKKPLTDKNGEVRPLTKADIDLFRPAQEVVSPHMMEMIQKQARGRPKKTEPKQQVTLRLDTDVIEHFRALGPGWQTRINAALRDFLH